MRPHRRRWRSRLIVGAAVVVAVIAAGTVAYARTGSAPAYRTAAVTRGQVTGTLDLVGTLTPTHSATVGFAQSGTVASVTVSPGQSVTAGQTLAQLDLTALQARLTQAQAAEATARQTLVAAENGQLPASSGGGPTSGETRSAASTGGTAAITAAQAKVVTAQKDVDTARGDADADLTAATAACPSATATSSDRTASSPSTSSSSASPTSSPSVSSGDSACLDAERTLLAAQESLAGKESALSAAQSTLSKALTSASAAPAGGGTAVSAPQLAAYQAALDADIAAVSVAQQNLDQGSAISPLTGTVVSVGVTPGQSVAAASSSAVITISSPDGYEVTTTVPTTAIARTAVGQTASVVPDGTSTTLSATVTAIAAAPLSTGYPVTLGLTGPTTGLRQGAAASVRLTTGTRHDAIVVPTSAVHTFGTRHVVDVLSGTTVQPTPVTVGIVDALRTEIVTGLKAGQQVVLADLSSTVTSDSSTTTGRGGALGGRTFGSRGLGGGSARRAGG